MNFPNDYGLHKHNMSDTAGIMTLQLRLERIQGGKKGALYQQDMLSGSTSGEERAAF